MKFFLIMGLFLLISNYSSAKESLNINNLESTQNNFFKQDSHNLNIEKTIVKKPEKYCPYCQDIPKEPKPTPNCTPSFTFKTIKKSIEISNNTSIEVLSKSISKQQSPSIQNGEIPKDPVESGCNTHPIFEAPPILKDFKNE